MIVRNNAASIIPYLKYNGPQHIAGVLEARKDDQKEIIKGGAVHLYDQVKKTHLYTVISDENGAYKFKNVDLTKFKFFIIAHHPTGEYNGVIADNIHGVQDVES